MMCDRTYRLQNPVVSFNDEYDVIVCGGGPAGCTAAIAAAREGAKTLLLEAGAMLGGMATLGMVNAWTPVHDGIRVIHGGLARKIIEENKATMPHIPAEKWDWLPINYEPLKYALDQMVTQSGARVLFHSHVCGVEMKDDRNIDVVLVANKAGLTAYGAKVFIDCTGDADLYAWAGKEYHKGDEQGRMQPTTMCFAVGGVDPETYPFMNDPYYTGQGQKQYALLHRVIADGKYNIPDDDHLVIKKMVQDVRTFNAGHVYGVDSTDPDSLSKACIDGRKLAWELKNALTEYAECFKNSYMLQTGATIGIRESRRIIGDYTFTMEDYLRRASFPDEILRGLYPIDIHEEEEGMDRNTFLECEHYGVGESYGLPYRCMCPRDLDNVLVAGRSMSSDRITNGSLRIMPCCMNAGEAAGIAAKFSCDMENVNIHKVDTQKLRKRLIEHGAYLPRLETDQF